jgi:gliding motility-associated lipoprotein GldH
VFEENRDLTDKTWKAYQEINYEFQISDTTRTYDMLFNIRNTSKYPNYNIYISYVLMDSIGNKLESDLRNMTLFDPKTGFPYGSSGTGDLFEHQFPIITNYAFPYPGRFSFSVEQKMRYENLPEIYSIGLRVAFTN